MKSSSCITRIAVGVLAALLATDGWADGGFIGKRDMREPEQKAAILFVDGVEDLILQVQYDGAESDFAWLVPLPSKPEVSVADGAIFWELRDYTFERSKWLSVGGGEQGGYGTRGGGGTDSDDGVTVLERKQVGVFDVAVLVADTVADLVRWCEGHDYKVSAKAQNVLAYYVDRDWIFTAMRIHPSERGEETEAALEAGTVQAMHFTFSTDEAIYPLRISSINRGSTEVLLYLLAEDTLIHPAFAQRHPASLVPFEQLGVISGLPTASNARDRILMNYDATAYSYRPISTQELVLTRGALPRWGGRSLYLTAMQQTFEPKQMEEDIVFKAPEQWDRESQTAFIATALAEERRTPDPLCLRMPEALVAGIGAEFDQANLESPSASLRNRLRLALQLEDAKRIEVAMAAARHDNPEVREALSEFLEGAWFIRTFDCPRYDQVIEADSCAMAHQRYTKSADALMPCHHRLESMEWPTVRGSDAMLAELFRRGEPDLNVAKMLAAMGTNESTALLYEAALGKLDDDSGRARNGRQEMALMALRHSSAPGLAGLYKTLYGKHRDNLNEREVSSCLVGLWKLNDPSTDSLVRLFEGYCQESQMNSAGALARNLLINRLRTRPPIVQEGMSLTLLEREMGGQGVIVNRLKAGGEDVVQYEWESGVATVKSDVVVKWKPSGA